MKKIRISESELVNLIEKLVKENLGNGVGQVFPLMGTPSEKYKDLLEKEDIEETDEISEDETNIDTAQGADQTLNLNIMNKTNQEDWMEGIEESKLINRLKRILKEKKGGNYCEDSPKGCIRKRAGGWVILDDNDPNLGVWRKCKSEKHCKSILAGYHASKR